MNYLLDTHTFIWTDSASNRLPDKVRSLFADRNNTFWLSLVSVWELQMKYHLGRLQLRLSIEEIIDHHRQAHHVEFPPITLDHILGLSKLPKHHSDPFDRLLISQALVEGFTLLSHDSMMSLYPVSVVW